MIQSNLTTPTHQTTFKSLRWAFTKEKYIGSNQGSRKTLFQDGSNSQTRIWSVMTIKMPLKRVGSSSEQPSRVFQSSTSSKPNPLNLVHLKSRRAEISNINFIYTIFCLKFTWTVNMLRSRSIAKTIMRRMTASRRDKQQGTKTSCLQSHAKA